MIRASDRQRESGRACGEPAAPVDSDSLRIDSALSAGIVGVCNLPDALVFACAEPLSSESRAYARRFAALLGAHLAGVGTPRALDTLAPQGCSAPRHPDLVIWESDAGDFPPFSRLAAPALHAEPACQEDALAENLSSPAPAAGLVVCQARWPITQILLIVCGQEADLAATEWATRVAGLSHGVVTALAVVPPAPAMGAGRPGIERGLPTLLGSDTGLGGVMRRVAQQLADSNIESTLRLREGPPDWQIRREVAQSDYDLIVVATQSCRWWLQWPEGDLVHSVVRWSDSPILAVRTGLGQTTARRE